MHRLLGLLTAAFALSAIASAQQDPPQWTSSANWVGGGLVRASDGNYYRALRDNTGENPIADNHTYWELYYVRANLVLTVGAGKTFSSLKQAWAMVSSSTIAPSISVLISIVSGGSANPYVESFSSPLNLNQVCGSQITIGGDNHVRLSFTNHTSGVTLTGGHTFGGIYQVTLDGGAVTSQTDGILVDQGSTLLGTDVAVENFDFDAYVDNGSRLTCDYSSFSHFGLRGIEADHLSYVHCHQITMNGNTTGDRGIDVHHGSHVDAAYAALSNIASYGVYADGGSTIDAQGSTCNRTGNGYTATFKSFIDASSGKCTNSKQIGYQVSDGGQIDASGTTFSGNQGGNFNISPNAASPDLSYIRH